MLQRDAGDRIILLSLIILAIAGFLLVWTSTQRFGPGMSPDALVYLSGAKNVAAGNGFVMLDPSVPSGCAQDNRNGSGALPRAPMGSEGATTLGTGAKPIVIWAPFFAHAIAGVSLTGLDLFTSTRLINSAAFAFLILTCGLWIRRTVTHRILAVPGAASVLLAKPLIYTASFVWSEVLFLLFMVLFLIEISNCIRRPTISNIVAAGVLGGIMFLTRYAGSTIVAGGALSLLVLSSQQLGKRVRDLVVFCVACAAVAVPWLARNYLLAHTITGERHPSQVPLAQNAISAWNTMVSWQLPSTLPLDLRRVVFFGVCLAIGWAVVQALRRRGSEQQDSNAPAVAAIVLLVFVPLLVLSASKVATDLLQDRLLSPAYVLMALLGTVALDRAVSSVSPESRRKPALLIAAAAFCVWLVFPMHTAYLVWTQYRLSGPGRYLKAAWTDAEFARQVGSLPAGSLLISNSPEAVFITSERRAVVSTHTSRIAVYEGLPPGVFKFAELIAECKSGYLIWYNDDGYRKYLHTIDDLAAVANFAPVYENESGTVYSISPITSTKGEPAEN